MAIGQLARRATDNAAIIENATRMYKLHAIPGEVKVVKRQAEFPSSSLLVPLALPSPLSLPLLVSITDGTLCLILYRPTHIAFPFLRSREAGFEKQYRLYCPRCSLLIAYETTPHLKSGSYTYVVQGSLNEIQGVPHDDWELELPGYEQQGGRNAHENQDQDQDQGQDDKDGDTEMKMRMKGNQEAAARARALLASASAS